MNRMPKTALRILAAIVALAPASARAAACEGVTLSDTVQIDGHPLVLNGMGVREATVFNVNVYVAGLYLEARSTDANAILDAESRKFLTLQFVRNVSRTDIVNTYSESFPRNAGPRMAALQDRFRQFLAMLSDVRSGQAMRYTYVPGNGLQVALDNQIRGTIPGADFARVFFSIWLGPNPPNAGLKSGLLGGRCG